jgi:hypothetical protein
MRPKITLACPFRPPQAVGALARRQKTLSFRLASRPPMRQPSAMTLPNDPHRAVADAARAIETRLIGIRRDIHAHPELAFQEVRTAGIVAA